MSAVCSIVDDWVEDSDSRVQMAEITGICQHSSILEEYGRRRRAKSWISRQEGRKSEASSISKKVGREGQEMRVTRHLQLEHFERILIC